MVQPAYAEAAWRGGRLSAALLENEIGSDAILNFK
jgi:hypothetical protein